MIQKLRQVLEMIRFSHTLFALPFALASAVLAWRIEPFRWLDILGILLCMVTARSGAMAFNRIADRKLDAANPRTANRHIPAGQLNVAFVTGFTLVCCVAFVLSTLIFVVSNGNWLPLYLSGPVLAFICAYSLTKRFTALCHFWLGASLMLAPIATWIALRGAIELTPVLLGLSVMAWVAGFDILYACQDIEFDRKAGLRSVPAMLGVRGSLLVAQVCHLIMACLLGAVGWAGGLGAIYYVGVALIVVLLIVEHALVRPSDMARVNLAFFHVNSIISVGILATVILDVVI